MEGIREELLLLRSSVPETDFIWNDSLMSDKAQSDWEKYLDQEADASNSRINLQLSLIFPVFSLRLQGDPEILLVVQYSALSSVQLFRASISAPTIAREDHVALSTELSALRIDDPLSSYPVFNLFTSLLSHIATFTFTSSPLPIVPASSSTSVPIDLKMKEVMLWSHHLLATGKRKNIIQWSVELGLFGISRPGYPGVIMVEGIESDVDEFVYRIKQLNWKALQVRYEFTGPTISPPDSIPLADHKNWIRLQYSKLRKVLDVGDKATVKEVEGMGDVGEVCRKAGLEDVFMTILKISK